MPGRHADRVHVAGEEGFLLLIEDHLPICPAGVAQPA